MELNKELLHWRRKLFWEEVFTFWHDNEAYDPDWQKLAKKRGFASWAEWRLSQYAEHFQCAKAEWGLYEISEPLKAFPDFIGGPFKTWVKLHYGDKQFRSFAYLATLPDIQNNPKVQSMMADFPINRVISCLCVGQRITVIEGMHRSCALACLAAQNKPFTGSILAAIGKTHLPQLPIVGKQG